MLGTPDHVGCHLDHRLHQRTHLAKGSRAACLMLFSVGLWRPSTRQLHKGGVLCINVDWPLIYLEQRFLTAMVVLPHPARAFPRTASPGCGRCYINACWLRCTRSTSSPTVGWNRDLRSSFHCSAPSSLSLSLSNCPFRFANRGQTWSYLDSRTHGTCRFKVDVCVPVCARQHCGRGWHAASLSLR